MKLKILYKTKYSFKMKQIKPDIDFWPLISRVCLNGSLK